MEENRHRQPGLPELLLGLLGLVGLACSLTTRQPPTPPIPGLEVATVAATPTVSVPAADATGALETVCFEALLTLDGQRLIFLDDVALATFYNLLDGYCDEPAARATFDFSTQMVVLAVEVTRGCTATLTPLSFDATSLVLQFSEQPGCAYDLVTVYMAALPRPAGAFEVRVLGA